MEAHRILTVVMRYEATRPHEALTISFAVGFCGFLLVWNHVRAKQIALAFLAFTALAVGFSFSLLVGIIEGWRYSDCAFVGGMTAAFALCIAARVMWRKEKKQGPWQSRK